MIRWQSSDRFVSYCYVITTEDKNGNFRNWVSTFNYENSRRSSLRPNFGKGSKLFKKSFCGEGYKYFPLPKCDCRLNRHLVLTLRGILLMSSGMRSVQSHHNLDLKPAKPSWKSEISFLLHKCLLDIPKDVQQDTCSLHSCWSYMLWFNILSLI